MGVSSRTKWERRAANVKALLVTVGIKKSEQARRRNEAYRIRTLFGHKPQFHRALSRG
jgi:hypothetical protein